LQNKLGEGRLHAGLHAFKSALQGEPAEPRLSIIDLGLR
jgi:hypothetical protein